MPGGNPREGWWYPVLNAVADGMEAVLRRAGLASPNVEVTRQTLPVTRYPLPVTDSPQPAARSPQLTVAQVSDFHLHGIGVREERVAEALEKERPDVLVITGDVVDDPHKLPLLEGFLGMVTPSSKRVLAILGNWEYFAEIDLARLRAMYERHGVELLVDETVVVKGDGASVAVTGFDDRVGGSPDPERALRDVPSGVPHVMLAHCPDYRDVLASHGAWRERANGARATMLSGHTHGGQIRVLGWAPIVPAGSGPYLSGWYRGDSLDLYVNRGIGTSLLPIRIGARPEVTFFEVALTGNG